MRWREYFILLVPVKNQIKWKLFTRTCIESSTNLALQETPFWNPLNQVRRFPHSDQIQFLSMESLTQIQSFWFRILWSTWMKGELRYHLFESIEHCLGDEMTIHVFWSQLIFVVLWLLLYIHVQWNKENIGHQNLTRGSKNKSCGSLFGNILLYIVVYWYCILLRVTPNVLKVLGGQLFIYYKNIILQFFF